VSALEKRLLRDMQADHGGDGEEINAGDEELALGIQKRGDSRPVPKKNGKGKRATSDLTANEKPCLP
jgi:hypothetical protein